MNGPRDRRRHAPATRRNRDPIVALLGRVLPPAGLVLEVGSGSGEHAVHFAERLPTVRWLPSDSDEDALLSIDAWRGEAGAANLLAPVRLDVTDTPWPVAAADGVVCINMIHIAPWPACLGLMAGAGRVLGPGGVLFLYGPFMIDGCHTAPSNAAFDASLRRQDAAWGVRDMAEVAAAAEANGLGLEETVAMPANNLSVVFRRT